MYVCLRVCVGRRLTTALALKDQRRFIIAWDIKDNIFTLPNDCVKAKVATKATTKGKCSNFIKCSTCTTKHFPTHKCVILHACVCACEVAHAKIWRFALYSLHTNASYAIRSSQSNGKQFGSTDGNRQWNFRHLRLTACHNGIAGARKRISNVMLAMYSPSFCVAPLPWSLRRCPRPRWILMSCVCVCSDRSAWRSYWGRHGHHRWAAAMSCPNSMSCPMTTNCPDWSHTISLKYLSMSNAKKPKEK